MSDTDRYISAMTQAKILLKRGVITKKEYTDFDTIIANWIKKIKSCHKYIDKLCLPWYNICVDRR